MRFAVVGSPIEHSKSPRMHMAAYEALGLSHTYEAIEMKELVLDDLRKGIFEGFNVTIPHKKRALDLSDDASDRARRADAANTLVRKDGKIVAHNTDVPAIMKRLDALGAKRERAVILGSGGAARAAHLALEEMGVLEIETRSRRGKWMADAAWDARATIVIQATSAGMVNAGDEVARMIAWDALPKSAVALEIIYAETPFLRAARARKIACENGLSMLVEQGALAFELWLGIPAPRKVMQDAVLR